jgi:DNA-directed RNA polymerase subunit RPC12/RpoP
MESTIFCKCTCNGDVIEYKHLYECKTCTAQIWKHSYNRDFKEQEVKKLFRGETLMLKGFKSNKNTLYDTKAKLENKKLELIFDNESKPTTLFLCKCGGDVTKISKGYKCNRCEQIVWERFMNKLLTFAQVKRLFKGDELKLENLKSKQGNIFNAEIFYIDKQLNLEYI